MAETMLDIFWSIFPSKVNLHEIQGFKTIGSTHLVQKSACIIFTRIHLTIIPGDEGDAGDAHALLLLEMCAYIPTRL